MNKNIDILIIIPNLNLGGTEKQLLKIFENSHSKKNNIQFLTILEKGYLAPEFERIGLKINCLNSFNWSRHNKFIKFLLLILISIKYILFIWMHKPKILHYYLPFAYWFGGMLSFFTPYSKKIMSRRSTNNYQKKYFFSSILERFLHSKMNLITANSLFIKNELLEETHYKKKILLIYNGVEIPNIKNYNSTSLFKKFNLNNQDIHICKIANFIPYKGHLVLLESFYQSSLLNKNLKLILIGEDRNNYKSIIIKKIDELKLNNKVLFFENTVNINEILCVSSLLISSSFEESLSNSILEAMSFGVPSIVTNVGGSPELISNNIEGLLVPKNNIKKTSEAIINVVSNNVWLKQMGQNSRIKAINNFNIIDKSKEHIAIYDKLLKEY